MRNEWLGTFSPVQVPGVCASPPARTYSYKLVSGRRHERAQPLDFSAKTRHLFFVACPEAGECKARHLLP